MTDDDSEDDRPPGERKTLKAPKETRIMAETFARDTAPMKAVDPDDERVVVFEGTFGQVPRGPRERAPSTDFSPIPTPTTQKIHQLADEPPPPTSGRYWETMPPVTDGTFERMVGRLCWMLLMSAGIVGASCMIAAWIFTRR